MNDCQSVALGDAAADLAVVDGTLVLPELGDVRDRDVVVRDDRIAALPESADPVVGPDTRVIDAAGTHVVPGFVDAHTHVDVASPVERTYHYSLQGGTTTVVTEASSFGAALGSRGVEQLLAVDERIPLAVRPTVPPQPLFDTFEPARADESEAAALADLLADERVVGVGEVGWIHVVGTDSPAERLFERARGEGVPVTGHGAGASGEKLAAFATVVDDDHEAISPEGVIERVEQGIHAIGRAGSVRDDLAAFAAASDRLGPAELSLCSDGTWPRDLIEGEHVNRVVRRAIEEGVDPVDAIRMATLNPSRHFGLAARGSLSPGSVADLVVLADLETVAVRDVVAGGEVVVADGDPLVGPREHDYPDAFYDAVAVDPSPADFRVPASATGDDGMANAGDGTANAAGNGTTNAAGDDGTPDDHDDGTTNVPGDDGTTNVPGDDGTTNVPGDDGTASDQGNGDGDDHDTAGDGDTTNAPGGGRVRAIETREGLLTAETTVEPPVADGRLAAAPDEDLLLAGLLDRHPDRDDAAADHRGFTGFLTGFGLSTGAVATTVTWEVPGLLAVGASPEAMARAARRVAGMGGGWAVVADGEVVAELALPVAGVAAEAPLAAVADGYAAVERALRDRGCDVDRPLLTLQTLSFPGVPRLKLSFSGYADVVGRRVVGLDPDGRRDRANAESKRE